MDPSKILAITNWKEPKSVKELRGYLGLTSYYRKFIKNYGRIAEPVTAVLKKNSFQWSAQATQSFQERKKAMSTALY